MVRIDRVSTAVLTSKGQTTIPKDVRDYLGLRPGDRIEFVLTEDKSVLLKPATRAVTDLKASCRSRRSRCRSRR